MSNELPYMPTFIGDFMAAVAGWPPDRVGAYWLALMYQWENGGLPADEADELAAILHVSRAKSRELWIRIAPKFHRRADGKWWNAKAEAVRREAQRQFAKASERGKKGANARWGKGSNGTPFDDASSNAQAMLKQCSSNANQNQNQVRTPPLPPARGGRRRLSPKLQAEAEQIRKTQEVKRLIAEGLTFVDASRRAGFT